jgi:hypothetical protein
MKYRSLIYIITVASAGLGSCQKEKFVEANTDPRVIYSIAPEEQFLNAGIRANNSDFEAYYDTYRRIMPWMQMNTGNTGNSKTFLTDVGNFNQRYNVLYPELGMILTDVQKTIEKMSTEDQAKYQQIHEIPDILKIYYSFFVSDINGSIPYNDAWQARYGGTTNPDYQNQQELYGVWDARLKEVIANLKATPSVDQVSLGRNDLYYHGDVSKWIKAASALRLRIATRLLKRDPSTAETIIKDALADASTQMGSNDDGWVMFADVTFTNGGNWNPTEFRAPKPTVDFMYNNSDPRLRDFYQKNNYTQANLNAAIAAGKYPPGTTWNPRQYVGAHISPDSSQGKYQSWFVGKKVDDQLTLDTVSYLQWRMWQPFANNGTGRNFFPTITYADYCLMRAEFAARGITSDDAEEWYNKGVTASIEFYDEQAKQAKLEDYTPLDAAEITAYLNKPDVKFDQARALEQIITQAYINFYKQPNEAWANFKRTGMPNKSTALANEDIVIDGVVRQIPRRAAISVPLPTDQNYAKKQAAIDQMATDPDFGQGPSDVFGRIWWDMK